MIEILDKYARTRELKEELEEKIGLAKRPFLEKMHDLEVEMNQAVRFFAEQEQRYEHDLRELNAKILETWDNSGPATIELQDGTKIVRSTMRSINVVNKRELLGTLLGLIQEDDKLPFTVKYTEKGILPLIDTGIIPKEVATIDISHRLSVRKQKD